MEHTLIDREIVLMSDQDQAGVLVTLDIVIPRLSPSGGWEVVLIQRNKEPFKGMWALPGGHLNTEDISLEAAAQREALEETGLEIARDVFAQVYTFEDFEDSRGKYLCLLYVLSEPLSSSATLQAGDDASRVQWYSIEDLRTLPDLAYNHIRLLRMALCQMFTAQYQSALGLQALATPCQCEVETSPGQRCANTAYWRYHGIAVCPRDIQSIVKVQGMPVLKRATEKIGG